MKICIESTEGGFLVYQDEPKGMEGMEGEESYGEPLASVDEALEAARMMMEGDGSMEQAAPMMDGEAEFTQGFNEARGGMGV